MSKLLTVLTILAFIYLTSNSFIGSTEAFGYCGVNYCIGTYQVDYYCCSNGNLSNMQCCYYGPGTDNYYLYVWIAVGIALFLKFILISFCIHRRRQRLMRLRLLQINNGLVVAPHSPYCATHQGYQNQAYNPNANYNQGYQGYTTLNPSSLHDPSATACPPTYQEVAHQQQPQLQSYANSNLKN